MLVLALLAGGLAPGMASASEPSGDAAMASPCHDMAGDLVAPPADDCCDDGNCACDCLHHAPVAFAVPAPLPHLAVRGVDERPATRLLPATRAAPEIRPPIA
ncbi:hypothetical protein K3217_17170 [bacterium BD-1]|nr:hypothetical protein [Ottowia caeni]